MFHLSYKNVISPPIRMEKKMNNCFIEKKKRTLWCPCVLIRNNFIKSQQKCWGDNVLELWLRWGWPVWPNLRGRKRPGSGSARRPSPTPTAGRWWTSSGCGEASCYSRWTTRWPSTGDAGGSGGEGGGTWKATKAKKMRNCSSFWRFYRRRLLTRL